MHTLLEYNSQIESYRYAFYFCLIVGLVFALLAILLSVIFKVDVIIGELTGSYKRKSIKSHKRKRQSVRPSRRPPENVQVATVELEEDGETASTVDMNETVVLGSEAADETVVLASEEANETVVLASSDINETVVLSPTSELEDDAVYETAVLGQNKKVELEEDTLVSATSQYL